MIALVQSFLRSIPQQLSASKITRYNRAGGKQVERFDGRRFDPFFFLKTPMKVSAELPMYALDIIYCILKKLGEGESGTTKYFSFGITRTVREVSNNDQKSFLTIFRIDFSTPENEFVPVEEQGLSTTHIVRIRDSKEVISKEVFIQALKVLVASRMLASADFAKQVNNTIFMQGDILGVQDPLPESRIYSTPLGKRLSSQSPLLSMGIKRRIAEINQLPTISNSDQPKDIQITLKYCWRENLHGILGELFKVYCKQLGVPVAATYVIDVCSVIELKAKVSITTRQLELLKQLLKEPTVIAQVYRGQSERYNDSNKFMIFTYQERGSILSLEPGMIQVNTLSEVIVNDQITL